MINQNEQPQPQQFWCHTCQQLFVSSLRPGLDEVACPSCHDNFCEVFSLRSPPNNFEPYQKPLPIRTRHRTRVTSHAVQLALGQYAEDMSAQRVRVIAEEDVAGLRARVEAVTDQCLICKQEMRVGSEVLKAPCGHLYHVDCLSEWLEYKNSCPKCRASILAG